MDARYLLQDAQGAYFPINGPTMIGRDPACQIRLADPEVSRNHALLWMERQTLYIRDENTRNGTFLGEWRIPPEKPVALSSGSQMRVGQTVLTVVSLRPALVQPPATVSVSAPPARPNRLPLILGLLVAAFCLGAFAISAVYLLLQFWTTR